MKNGRFVGRLAKEIVHFTPRLAPTSSARMRLHRPSFASVVQRCSVICLAAISNATAAGSFTGTIASQQAMGPGGGVFFLNLNGTSSQSPPSCATLKNRFVINPATDSGKAQIAVIVSALARGSTITIQGSGACDLWPDTESILWVLSN